ncbi:MAG: DUF1223 domain-containing protein [Burkholderiales bacterium]|nr:DUF1223 domain-containing protein [Burkholderiales bacterium]
MSSPLLNAAQCQASSGPQRVALLELYTSEGCSSCPPADRWLSGIASQGFGPERMVPLALHVDYWDYIGWKDRFANPVFSARQRDLVRGAGGRTVYTPQFMLNARDFRGMRGDTLTRAVDEINRLPAGADIKLVLKSVAKDNIEVAVTALPKTTANAVLYVALYQNDLSSEVRAGENSGVRLHHDYVVREWRGPIKLSANTANVWQQLITLKPDWVTAKMGVVAFVQDQSSGDVLQVLRLPLCPA